MYFSLGNDDCRKDFKAMKTKGAKFYDEPTEQPYDIEVVFEDLY